MIGAIDWLNVLCSLVFTTNGFASAPHCRYSGSKSRERRMSSESIGLGALLDADWARLLQLSGASHRKRRLLDVLSPRFAAVAMIRLSRHLHLRGWRRLSKLVAFLDFFVFGIEFTPQLDIGPGLVIPHTHGTVLGAGRIGKNATIYQQVTLGAKLADFAYDPAKRPDVGDDVTITSGAKILGAVCIGNGAVIGANAVVLQDVPDGAVAVGVPARIVMKELVAKKDGEISVG
jgi:serine O-acetyltransferase